MRTVTPEEAKASLNRLSSWTNKENKESLLNNGTVGEWIFTPNKQVKKTEKERIAEEQTIHTIINEKVEKVLQKVEKETGLSREKYSTKSKKSEYLNARVYAAYLLRLEVGLSEELISKLIGISKSMVNTYLNHTESYIRDVDYYKKYKEMLE